MLCHCSWKEKQAVTYVFVWICCQCHPGCPSIILASWIIQFVVFFGARRLVDDPFSFTLAKTEVVLTVVSGWTSQFSRLWWSWHTHLARVLVRLSPPVLMSVFLNSCKCQRWILWKLAFSKYSEVQAQIRMMYWIFPKKSFKKQLSRLPWSPSVRAKPALVYQGNGRVAVNLQPCACSRKHSGDRLGEVGLLKLNILCGGKKNITFVFLADWSLDWQFSCLYEQAVRYYGGLTVTKKKNPTTNFLLLVLILVDSFNRISQPLNVIVPNEVNGIIEFPLSSCKNARWGQWARSYDQYTKYGELMPGRKHRLFYLDAISDPTASFWMLR